MKILLVEDSESDAFLLRDALEQSGQEGLELEVADCLQEALDRLDQEHPDLLLLDLGLPECEGMETLERIQARAPDVPVVVLTGLDDDALALEAVREGAQDFLVKGRLAPVDLLRSLRYAEVRGRQERERRELEKRLRESMRVEAAGRLAGGLAHGFNGILAVVAACGEALGEIEGDPEAVRAEAERLLEAAGRGRLLTRELLAFSSQQELEPRRLDLGSLLQGIEPLLQHLVGSPIHLRIQVPAVAAEVVADPSQVERIVMNLVSHARDSMPLGGEVEIRLEEVVVEEERPGGAEPGDYLCLVVEDDGIGIPPERLERLFEPDLEGRELGNDPEFLGLAPLYGIVRQSQGWIEVESEPDRGSCFRVLLPRRPSEVGTWGSRGGGGQPGGLGILLVEDDRDLRFLVGRTLRRAGYQVFEAAHGLEALEMVREEGALPHLLLTNVVMPHMGGVELARKLRERDPELPVVFLSGYPESSLTRAGQVPEGYVFIQKPFLARDLFEILRNILSS